MVGYCTRTHTHHLGSSYPKQKIANQKINKTLTLRVRFSVDMMVPQQAATHMCEHLCVRVLSSHSYIGQQPTRFGWALTLQPGLHRRWKSTQTGVCCLVSVPFPPRPAVLAMILIARKGFSNTSFPRRFFQSNSFLLTKNNRIPHPRAWYEIISHLRVTAPSVEFKRGYQRISRSIN